MEHGPTSSKTPEPQTPAHQTPPGAPPAPGEHRPFFLWQLAGVVVTTATRFGGVVAAKAWALRRAGHPSGNGDALMIGRMQAEAQRLEVEGALVEGERLQAGVGAWGGEMEERAAEAAWVILERKRAKDELLELGKKHEVLQAETERLRVRFVEAVKQALGGAGGGLPLWLTANGVLQRLDGAKADGERAGAEVEKAREYFERTEKVAESLIRELGRVLGGDRESVAGVGGTEVEVEVAEAQVQEGDAMVEPKSEEAARELARD